MVSFRQRVMMKMEFKQFTGESMKSKSMYVGVFLILLSGLILADTTKTIPSHASWPRRYSNTTELSDASDLVVVGQVTKSETYKVDGFMVFTDHTILIEKTIKGSSSTKYILIHQTGGKYAGTLSYVLDDPLLPRKTKMVLFLREFAPSEYTIRGGPQGRFHVLNSKVYSIGELYPEATLTTQHLSTSGISLEQFIQSIPN